MPIDLNRCPLCGWDAQSGRLGTGDAYSFRCALCGKFTIVRTLLVTGVRDEDRTLLPFLSSHIRQETERGNVVELNTSNWRDLALAHAHTAVSRKLEKTLEYIAVHSGFPGDQVAINYDSDYPLFDAVSGEELQFLIKHLAECRLLHQGQLDGRFVLSAEGWARLEPTGSGGIPGRCFVAMSFDGSLVNAYEQGIRPAIEEDCKLTAIRVDLMEHNEKICDRILSEIKKAEFMVADFTLHRAGVYFEAGYAMGLGRPVIWTCRRDELGRTHFDTRQYNHIDWATPAEYVTLRGPLEWYA